MVRNLTNTEFETFHSQFYRKFESYYLDNDLVRISQVCRRWREVTIGTGVIRRRMEQLGEPELDENTVTDLEKKYGLIDDVFEYCYTRYSKDSGVVYGWGHNRYGQLTGDQDSILIPEEITEFGVVTEVVADRDKSFVIKNGELIGTGKNESTEYDFTTEYTTENDFIKWFAPEKGTLPPIKSFATNGSKSLVIDTDDRVWAWGAGRDDFAGDFYVTPRMVYTLRNYKIKQVEFSRETYQGIACCLTSDGEVFIWNEFWDKCRKLDVEPISQISCGSGTKVA